MFSNVGAKSASKRFIETNVISLKSLSPEDIELFGDTLDADNNGLVDDFIGGKWKGQPHGLPIANDIV